MARISNTSVYPNINPVLSDYFVLTDANDDLSTKTCTLESLQQLYNVDVVSKSITVSPLYLNVLAILKSTNRSKGTASEQIYSQLSNLHRHIL